MSWYEPIDRTGGELPVDEQRTLVRRIADVVGRQVSARVEAAAEAGTPMTADAEKVASSTEIQQALRSENERRLRSGLDPLSDTALAGLHDMVLAHVYGLGELDDLWNNPEVENIDCNGAGVVFVTFAGGLVKDVPAGGGEPRGLLGSDPPGRPPARRGRGAVRRPASEAGPAAAGRITDVRRLRRAWHQRCGRRDLPVHPPSPVPGAVDRGAGRARVVADEGRPVRRRRVGGRRERDRRRRLGLGQDDDAAGLDLLGGAAVGAGRSPSRRRSPSSGLHRSGRLQNVVALFSRRRAPRARAR